MAIKMRRNFSNAMRAHVAADGTWRVTQSGPADTGRADTGRADTGRADTGRADLQIIVIGADPRMIAACSASLHDLDIEWHTDRVLLTTVSAGRAATLEAKSVIVHEALPGLYRALPLADFDARARRFWRRVFLLVCIPGGRRLLGTLARLSRNKP